VVYQWADGIYVKAGLEKDKAALLVIIELSATAGRSFLPVRADIGRARNPGAGVLRGLEKSWSEVR